MKEQFLTHTLNFITENQQQLNSKEEKEKLLYGLEGLYLTITKLLIIFILALLLNFFKPFIFTLLLFNILRYPGFGFHASSSIICLISSTLLILGLPYLFFHISIPYILKIILSLSSIVLFLIYAPADTRKRPLTNRKKRLIRKTCATILAILYSIAILLIHNSQISNLILSALLIEVILILPTTYKFFHEPYGNYKMV